VFRAVLSLLLTAGFLSAATAPAPQPRGVHNFIQVNDGIFRGAEPSPDGLIDLRALNVSTIIDLREKGEGTEQERKIAQGLGMKYINIPLKPFSAPSQAQVEYVLSLLQQQKAGKIFVHCHYGKDRTGTVIACYRIEHEGWSNARALSEAKQDGLRRLEPGMKNFILHFAPTPAPQASSSISALH
jgi:tyrosine-protein phosphatase SIW14